MTQRMPRAEPITSVVRPGACGHCSGGHVTEPGGNLARETRPGCQGTPGPILAETTSLWTGISTTSLRICGYQSRGV